VEHTDHMFYRLKVLDDQVYELYAPQRADQDRDP